VTTQERGKEHHHGHDQHEVEAAAQVTVHELQAQLAKRDEEVRMLKEAYKQRMREKEEEFKQRWAAQNEAEALAHKLNEAESRAKVKETEAKRLQEQVHQLNLLVQSLKKEKKHKKAHGGKHHFDKHHADAHKHVVHARTHARAHARTVIDTS
jgi:chromosome segregation ATPase